MNSDKQKEFLESWAKALEKGYDVPVTFIDGLRIKDIELDFNEKKYPFLWAFSPGYSRRKEFMDRERRLKEERKRQGCSPRWLNDENPCFLCDAVGQALASETDESIPRNFMYSFGKYVIVPNKYPGFSGASLFVPEEHDLIEKRVQPIDGKYFPQEGKTRGEIMTPDYLENLVYACERFDLVGLNNHALDGMSIPSHKHFHLLPGDLKIFSSISYILQGKTQTAFGEGIYQAENTPFDTLVVEKRKERSSKFAERLSSILGKMETSNEVFTMVYSPREKMMTISPRIKSSEIVKNIGCGNMPAIHVINQVPEEKIQEHVQTVIEKYIPLKGEYNWGKFV